MLNMYKKIIMLLITLSTVLSITSCTNSRDIPVSFQASNDQAFPLGGYQPKNFLSNYSKLVRVEGDAVTYRYRDPDVKFVKYKKLLVDRIQFRVREDAEYKTLEPVALQELTDYFHQAIADSFSDKYQLVDQPGPDVLRLRIAVVDVVPNQPSASVLSLVVPFLWFGEAGAGVAQGEPGSTPFLGEVSIELEVLDSQTSQQIAAYIETRIGKKYVWNKGLIEGTSSYIDAYSTWAYTKKAISFWASLLRERLDTLSLE